MLVPHAPARPLVLPAPGDAERSIVKIANATPAAGASPPLAIGFGRDVPLAKRRIQGTGLTWIDVAGGRAARIEVGSEGAAAIRIAISMRTPIAGGSMRFAGSAEPGRVFGPVSIADIVAASRADDVYWSPALEGSTGHVEVFVPADVALTTFDFEIVRISHLLVGGASLNRLSAKNEADVGKAGSCEKNLVCANAPVRATIARNIAKMMLTRANGQTHVCTGTLLDDTRVSGVPYFYTASRCADSQAVASTLVTYWFFQSTACDFSLAGGYDVATSGAVLLARGQDSDWALLRLNGLPPNTNFPPPFVEFRAEPITTDESVISIHHPMGDLRKVSEGRTTGSVQRANGSTAATVEWDVGVMEPGSDGGGLFQTAGGGGRLEFRGSYTGGNASCANPGGRSDFSPLSDALPTIREYLTPDARNPTELVPVVEFYNPGLDHFFISTSTAEIADLDSGVHAGWVRTGLRFLAYSNPAVAPTDAKAVCRFYRAPAYGDSHFYSASLAECTATAAAHPLDWVYESPNVFYIQLPDPNTGICPPTTRPVFRFFSTLTTNHRYTAEIDVRDALRATPGWIAEGYGPDAVIMCSPKG
jgi:hypothetical protein